MQTFAIVNQKGGCGKTTTAINLAGVFAGRGFRTLLVDMDPQGHCAAGLAIPENRIDLHIGDAMLAGVDAPVDPKRLLWRVSRNLDLAPSTVRLAALEAPPPRGELAGKPNAERRLKEALSRFDSQYDICLIDCSPAIGLLAFNALVAADEVLIPVETGFFSLQGATKQVSTIKSLGKRLGVAPMHRVLATMHDPASMLSKDLLEELRRRFTNRLVPVVIRFDQALKEAASFGQPVIEYSPESQGARDYAMLADFLVSSALGADKRQAAAADEPDEGEAGLPAPAAAPAAEGPDREMAGLPTSRAADLVNRARRLQSRGSEAAAAAVVEVKSTPVLPARSGEAEPMEAPATAPTMPAEAGAGPERSVGIESAGRARLSVGFGPQITPNAVVFRVPAGMAAGGRAVAVAGDFNQWSADRHVMRLNEQTGSLEVVVFMPPGSMAQYRLVVDGQWIADPYNPCVAPNPFGGTNSVVAVPMMAGDLVVASGSESRQAQRTGRPS